MEMQIYRENLGEWMTDYVEKDKFNGCSLSIADTYGNTVLDIASGFNDKENYELTYVYSKNFLHDKSRCLRLSAPITT